MLKYGLMSNKKRLLLLISIFSGIIIVAFFVIRLAQGYRPDFSTKSFKPTGLLVATSIPDGAQLWIDGKLKSATNTTISLSPGKYEVEIKKDGFTAWKKTLQLKKELVTQTDAYLFSTYPNLTALTFTGAANPLLSPDGQRVIFAVSEASAGKNGLWVLDLADRPLGFPRGPRQIIASAAGGRNFAKGTYVWSPDSKQILLTLENRPGPSGKTTSENFLLDADKLNLDVNLVDISSTLLITKQRWEEEETIRKEAQISKLPKKLLEIIGGSVENLQFSPDETKILYTATASASIPKEIIPFFPTASTQPESRQIEPGKIYVYDLKEDRNFYIMDKGDGRNLSWFPTSRHLFFVEEDKATIIEYDGTNQVVVYSGPFENAFAFSFPAGNRILVLTTIGKDTPANLYAISLR